MLASTWTLSGFESGLLYTALGVFAGASVVGLGVVTGRRQGRPLRPMLTVGVVALTALVATIALRAGRIQPGRSFEVLVWASWILGAGALVVDRKLERRVMSAVAAPMLALLVLFALLLAARADGARVAHGAGVLAHILLAVLGVAAFAVAAGVGLLYLRQIRDLKRDPASAVAIGMPSLERLDRLNFVAAVVGFPLLVLSVVAGWVFLAEDQSWLLDPTVLATLAGLVVYIVLFCARAFLGWRGRRVALLTVIGFFVFVVGYVVAAFCTSASAFHG